MFKRLKNILKGKKGSASLEAMIMIPIWLVVVAYLGVNVSFYRTASKLEDALYICSSYVAIAETPDEAVRNINSYIKERADNDLFPVFSVQENFVSYKIKTATGYSDEITNMSELNLYYVPGTVINMEMTMNTSFSNGTLTNFQIGDYTFTFLPQSSKAFCSVVIANGSGD